MAKSFLFGKDAELRFLGGIQEYVYTDYFSIVVTITCIYIYTYNIYIYIYYIHVHILHTLKIVVIEMFYPG